jgi:hypothetical protein
MPKKKRSSVSTTYGLHKKAQAKKMKKSAPYDEQVLSENNKVTVILQ